MSGCNKWSVGTDVVLQFFSLHAHPHLAIPTLQSIIASLSSLFLVPCRNSNGPFLSLLIPGSIYVLESRRRGCSRLFYNKDQTHNIRFGTSSPLSKVFMKTAVCSAPDVGFLFCFDSRDCHVSARRPSLKRCSITYCPSHQLATALAGANTRAAAVTRASLGWRRHHH